MLYQFVRHSPRAIRSAALVLALSSGLAVASQVDSAITVNVDQAKLVKFPGNIATIVVGNPLIADVTVRSGGLVIVTGKGYGATNVVAMDRAGDILMDRQIEVGGPTDRVVTMYRGVQRESYSCTPVCQRRVTLGDDEPYFKSTMDQAEALNSRATESARKKTQ